MIDCISGGRLIAGFPVGTPMDTCYAYGQNPSHAARALPTRRTTWSCSAWTEKDTFAFNGRFNQQRYVNIWPRPIQQPHPPIWIPGGGSVETWQWCAEMDYVYCYLSYYGYKAGQSDDERLLGRDGAARQGPQSRTAPASCSSSASPRAAQQAIELYTRGRRVFLRPLPARRSALRRAARLHHRGDAARRHREPGQDGGGRQAARPRQRRSATRCSRSPAT